jgi:hypothetical protein
MRQQLYNLVTALWPELAGVVHQRVKISSLHLQPVQYPRELEVAHSTAVDEHAFDLSSWISFASYQEFSQILGLRILNLELGEEQLLLIELNECWAGYFSALVASVKVCLRHLPWVLTSFILFGVV